MSERWDQVTALFWAARALHGDLRDSFLKIACNGDDNLRGQVEALLSTDTVDDGFLEDAAWAGIGRALIETSLVSGQVLKGRYRIEHELATGGQAIVYRANDELLGRPVVVKLMRAEGARNRSLRSRFEQEMQALAQIEHPGVVGILDVGELDDGSPFLVIQHISGVSLREALSQGPLPNARAAAILRQIGAALHAAHLKGIAHQDLKPENVMLQQAEGAETVRLIDFGIAKIDASDVAPGVTTVMVAGTVRYMAPEQFEGKNSIACDIYSLGLVACEMLSGHPNVTALRKNTRRQTRSGLEAALAFKPDDRPDNVQTWCERLAQTLVATPGQVFVRSAAWVALLVILVFGASAATNWYLNKSGEAVRIIEKVGAFDPLTESFTPHNDITGTVTENPARTGYDGWRVFTGLQGYYFHSFTLAQKRRALERGWKVTSVFKVDEGVLTTGVDFASMGGRFDINVLLDGDREIVRLLTQIVPDMRGMEFVQQPPKAYHRYELIYDAVLKSADLWIDGERRLTGYRGHGQYLEDRGLDFGTLVYKSDRGSGSFQSVRFEINP